jgi:hypothetical protein
VALKTTLELAKALPGLGRVGSREKPVLLEQRIQSIVISLKVISN